MTSPSSSSQSISLNPSTEGRGLVTSVLMLEDIVSIFSLTVELAQGLHGLSEFVGFNMVFFPIDVVLKKQQLV
jgi:hypothetical protein